MLQSFSEDLYGATYVSVRCLRDMLGFSWNLPLDTLVFTVGGQLLSGTWWFGNSRIALLESLDPVSQADHVNSTLATVLSAT